MGIQVIYPKPNTSKNNTAHPIYPYLLGNLTLTYPNQVWSTDITYLPMPHGWLYLVAVIDWYSRRVLAWRVSVTLEATFCIAALEEAIRNYGTPKIFNTDQGVQFTSHVFINLLEEHSIKISMDGKGRCADNIFCERFWRTIKYEEIYLKEYQNPADAINHIRTYILFYNTIRIHQHLDYHTPHELYTGIYHTTTAHQMQR
jgi:putative transposase